MNLRRFRRSDGAVSPVIAVILMVAITVVLAATVYVWVSGFGAQSSQPAKTLAVSSSGAVANNGAVYWKNYTIASASPGLRYQDVEMHLNGAKVTFEAPASCAESANDRWKSCAGTTPRATADLVTAGDTLTFRSSSALAAQTLRVIDPNSNSVILTLTVS